MDNATSGRCYLHSQPSENDIDGEEIMLLVCNSITSLCKPSCPRGPLSLRCWSTTGKNLPSYQLLHHSIEFGHTLPLFENLYNEVVPIQWELTNKLPPSYAYLFVVYQKLIQGCIRKLTIKQWITFWFQGSNNLIRETKPLSQGYCSLSSIQRLCEWIRDVGCICPSTFKIASIMASSTGCCLPTTILALQEVSCSSHPARSENHFLAHFLYAWREKNFDTSLMTSSNLAMVKYSGLDRAKSFQIEEPEELINFWRAFC
ncbi:LOW QUALITY PROTEIN: hypothetical protein Cgig2_014350 [Carnegiea gigantea]|uniref:Uncharacterized protein n=1 Tax=Carnegiea gigantea TaxID=171969 RepID=A0A9Q1Q692_9CARY|nr:LOW QUALITY PROTEIN: hypothetical protein Cgig2_014350 [Carnegiea gigantea]